MTNQQVTLKNMLLNMVEASYYLIRVKGKGWGFCAKKTTHPANGRFYPSVADALHAFTEYEMEGNLRQIKIDESF